MVGVGHTDGSMQVWDTVACKTLMRELRAGNGPILGLAFSLNGERLLSISERGGARVWTTAFQFPHDESDMRPALELLTGYDLDVSGAEAPRHLDRAEWLERYRRIFGE